MDMHVKDEMFSCYQHFSVLQTFFLCVCVIYELVLSNISLLSLP